MTQQMPTQIKVTFSRVCEYHHKEVPGAIWDYYITKANEEVCGFAGGLLTKNSDGLWVAHYWSHATGAPAKTREQAILNVLPLAAKVVDGRRVQRAEYERVYNERWATAKQMTATFPSSAGLVTVHDITADREKESPEPRYKVTITFDNFTAEQVYLLAAKYQETR